MTSSHCDPSPQHRSQTIGLSGWMTRLWQHLSIATDWDTEQRTRLLILLACTSACLPHLGSIPAVGALAMVAILMWRFKILWRRQGLPAQWLANTLALLTLAGVYGWAGTLVGRTPGVVLIVIMSALKTLEMQRRRDQLVSLALAVFCSMTIFLSQQEPWDLAAVIASNVLVIAALHSMVNHHRLGGIADHLRAAALLMAQAIPFAAVMFLLFPRLPAIPWAQAEEVKSAGTGISNQMSPGDIGSLIESEKVVMTIEFDRQQTPPMEHLYFRGPVMSTLRGNTWLVSEQEPLRIAPTSLRIPDQAKGYRYRALVEPHKLAHAFALDYPLRLGSPDVPVQLTQNLQVNVSVPFVQPYRFDGTAYPTAIWGQQESEEILRHNRQLPSGLNPRTQAWAQQLAQSVPADPQREQLIVQSVLQHFHSADFHYTMTPPRLGDQGIDEFMFLTRQGFCEHYASAFAFIMRSVGIPARVVTGYQGGEPDPKQGTWIVRQRDAHAWTEVWLRGQGWTRIDPTQAIAPHRIHKGSRELEQSETQASWRQRWLPESMKNAGVWLRQTYDRADRAWRHWVTGFNANAQTELLQKLGLKFEDSRELARFFGLTLLGTSLLMALWFVRKPRPRTSPETKQYERWLSELKRLGVPMQHHDTPLQLAARLGEHLQRSSVQSPPQLVSLGQEIASLYSQLRYQPQPPAETLKQLTLKVAAFRAARQGP